MQLNIKVSYKLISTLWVSKISARWYYYYWWTWSSIFKVLKVTSLQYLYNIWEKKLGIEFIFLYNLALSFLMEVARHVQSTQNRKLVKFLQYIKKNVLQLLLCSIVMQNIQILYRVSVMFVVTCFCVIVDKNRCGLLGISKICYISRMIWWEWAEFLHADTNLGKLNVDLIIIGWVCSKMDETF